jgi:hypothetical protein
MTEKEKNKAAQEMARLRAESLTPERRSEIARNAQKFSVISRLRRKSEKVLGYAHNSTDAA